MTNFELVITGGGLTAARAITSYRESGGAGRIALLAKEPVLPYHRPALSKRFLRGETADTPFVEDEAFYADHDVEVLLGAPVVEVHPGDRAVTVEGGARYRYEQLLLATGATPRRLRVPGSGLPGVHELRTVADSQRIREAAGAASRAVVVGGGFIGMEVAASLTALGLRVTLIHLGSGLFDQLRAPGLSAELAELYADRGVELWLGEHVASFAGRTRLEAVQTASGRSACADLAVVGVGVVPEVGFLAGSGIAVDNGVVVDDRFESNVPGVYAAGDVASFHDPVFGRRRRVEHWSNASYQGTEVGRILAGARGGYDIVSSFFTEVFGVTLKVFGDTSEFDELRSDGSLAEGDLVLAYEKEGRVVAAATVGQTPEVEAELREAIAGRAPARALAA